MDNARILKGYRKAEQRELEEAKNNNYSSAMILIHGIGEEYSDCQALSEKYYHEDTNEDNQLARDIVDYYTDKAKFPEQKYVVHDSATGQYIYYSFTRKVLRWGSLQLGTGAERKTKDEWLAISPAYEPMLEKVEN